MREIMVRGFSGLLYVAIIVSSALFSNLALIIVLFIFSALALFEFQRLLHYKSPVPLLFFGLLAYQFYTGKLNNTLHYGLLALGIFTNILLAFLLVKKKSFDFAPFQKSGLTLFYLISSGYFIIASTAMESSWMNGITLSMYFLIWTNNSFAYVFGKKWGKNTLFPEVSPKKTWEGFWGGALACFLLSLVLLNFHKEFKIWVFPLLALIIIIASTLGDLIQSKFKREANVKDSGSLIPGHGGFYDRMDSVLYTAPFVNLFLIIVHYVS
ncbi:MAG: phosphatidate cytidylyltransferase [Flavobacteriaceae bacterium]|nr:phosphatidate cytidylyltransferase [Flavobacteriaceae bacterium]MDG1912625.1 phosphatidate cytidylyltransferase [Flavobacteriaceae bacterium]